MSYCVNCGVELEASLQKCPLCNTPVINPKDINKLKEIQSPYPERKGIVEEVGKKDIIIILSVVFGFTALCCALLNYLVYNSTKWSLLVIGVCGVMWMLTVPPLIIRNLKKRIFAFFNAIMVCIYLGLIGDFIGSGDWVIDIGIPITLTVFVLIEIFLTVGKHTKSFLVMGALTFSEVAVLCVAIEMILRLAAGTKILLTWSAIVLTVCVSVVIVLVTMFSRKRVRDQVGRRFHL